MLLLCGALAVGCAQQGATAPGKLPDDVESLEQLMAADEARIDRLVQSRAGEVERDKKESVTLAQPEAPEAPPPPQPATEETSNLDYSGSERQESPCETACKALASMQRSAERICEIVGEADSRCTRARERVAESTERVKNGGCACASAGEP